jgi:hypothetical protein
MAQSKKQRCLAAVTDLIRVVEASGRQLPNDGTALKLGEILAASGVSRTQLHRHPEIKVALMEYATAQGLSYSRQGRVVEEDDGAPVDNSQMVSIARLHGVQMQLAAAERKNAELRAENARLRAQMMRGDEVAELIASGGRIVPGLV